MDRPACGWIEPTLTKEAIAANHKSISNLSTCLMLSIAYAGSIGGIATVIGSPLNSFLVSFLQVPIAVPALARNCRRERLDGAELVGEFIVIPFLKLRATVQ